MDKDLNIDLRQLRVLDDIYKSGSLSRTADRLGLTQPGISMTLNKLRAHFQDPLFVRVGNEMRPTALAMGLRVSVSRLITAAETMLNYRDTFVAETTTRTFRVAMSEQTQLTLLAALTLRLRELAPRASFHFERVSDRTPALLESGQLDLAIGLAPQMPDGFFQQALFQDHFVCLARAGHPRIGEELTLANFRAESHVVVISSSATHLILERALKEQHVVRQVAAWLPSVVTLPKLIAESDLIALLPRRVGLAIAADAPRIAAHEPPLSLPSYSIAQYWHEYQSKDSGLIWLREVVAQRFGTRASRPESSLERESPVANATGSRLEGA